MYDYLYGATQQPLSLYCNARTAPNQFVALVGLLWLAALGGYNGKYGNGQWLMVNR
jgi:hypothetical protein